MKVAYDGKTGSLTIYYGTLDQLDGLLSRITQGAPHSLT